MQSQVPLNINQLASSPNSLLSNPEVQEIDKRLSSGIYACYKCWLYVMAILAALSLLNSLRLAFTSTSGLVLLNVFEGYLETCFALYMLEVLKKKKLEDAKDCWINAVLCFIVMAILITIHASSLIRVYGSELFYGGVAVLVIYYGLVIGLPAWKVKALIERREAIIKGVNPYNNA